MQWPSSGAQAVIRTARPDITTSGRDDLGSLIDLNATSYGSDGGLAEERRWSGSHRTQ